MTDLLLGIDDAGEATLGLGWDVALRCVEHSGRDAGHLRGDGAGDGAVTRLLPRAADRFFRAERIAPAPEAEGERGFAILVVTEGTGRLEAEAAGGEPLDLKRGDTVLLPWAAGRCRLTGDLVALACRPPAVAEGGAE